VGKEILLQASLKEQKAINQQHKIHLKEEKIR
jgi:hypothetical protein